MTIASHPYKVIKHKDHAHEDAIWSVCWASNNRLVTGSLDTTAKIWNVVDLENKSIRLEEYCVLDGHALGVVSVAVSPTGSILATAAMDCKIRLFDLDKPIEESELKTIDAGPCESWTIQFSPDGKYIATSNLSGKISLFTTSEEDDGDAEPKVQYDAGKFVYSVDFSHDGKKLAAGNIDGWIQIFDLETEKLVSTTEAHALPIKSVAFSPDSKYLLSGSDDTQIKVHSIETKQDTVKTLTGHGSWVRDLSFSPNGKHFASGSTDKTVRIWDFETFSCIERLTTHTNQVSGVRYSPDGNRLASVSEDTSIVIYQNESDPVVVDEITA